MRESPIKALEERENKTREEMRVLDRRACQTKDNDLCVKRMKFGETEVAYVTGENVRNIPIKKLLEKFSLKGFEYDSMRNHLRTITMTGVFFYKPKPVNREVMK